jgi:hypothetical protein
MRKACLILSVCLLAHAHAPAPATAILPSDVATFIEDRGMCESLAGEFPDPKQREQFDAFLRKMERYCSGTDRKLADLKKKYRGNKAVLRRLNEYDPRLEGNQ